MNFKYNATFVYESRGFPLVTFLYGLMHYRKYGLLKTENVGVPVIIESKSLYQIPDLTGEEEVLCSKMPDDPGFDVLMLDSPGGDPVNDSLPFPPVRSGK